MSYLLQDAVVVLLITGALVFLANRALRSARAARARRSRGCGPNCGCD